MAIKNQAITVQYVAWDTGNNVGKTGDVANHTIKIVQDGVVATPAASPAEVDATNVPGVYKIALAAAEMNFGFVTVGGVSSTSNIVIIPVNMATQVNPDVSLDISRVTHTYTVVDGDGNGIEDVLVEAKQDTTLIQSTRTDSTGAATFYLAAGTYDFYATKSGFTFASNPDSEVVA